MTFIKQHKGLHSKKSPTGIFILPILPDIDVFLCKVNIYGCYYCYTRIRFHPSGMALSIWAFGTGSKEPRYSRTSISASRM